MKYTLLQLTQAVLRSIKGEEVTSYTDTAESTAVAGIIKECYYNILATQDFPEHKILFPLVENGGASIPTLCFVPTNVLSIDWIKYNRSTTTSNIIGAEGQNITDYNYETLTYLPMEDFLDQTLAQDVLDANVISQTITINSQPIIFLLRNDKHPEYYTSYNDNAILFDSYNATFDTYIRADKTLCSGILEPTWTDSDSFTPNLDAQQFNILVNEAKAMAWQELKSIENQSALKRARDIKIFAEEKKNKVNYENRGYYYTKFPNYGRK